MTTPLRFVSVGFGNAVCANRIIAVMIPGSAPAKRRVKQARETGTYIDLTFGRAQKSILLQDDGSLVGSGITGKTILARIMQPEDATDEE